MEGETHNKNAIPPRLGLNPDDPLPSVERTDTGSPESAAAIALLTIERSQQQGGMVRNQHRRTASISQIPQQHFREPRGSDSTYAANLSQFLGPLNPRGRQKLDINPVPATISSSGLQTTGSHNWQSSSQVPSKRSSSRSINTRDSGHLASQVHPSSRQSLYNHQVPDQTTTSRGGPEAHRSLRHPQDTQQQPSSPAVPAFRSGYAQVPTQNSQYSGPVSYNPLTLALDPDNTGTLNYPPTQAPRKLHRRGQSHSSFSLPGLDSYIQQSSIPQSHQAPIQDNSDGEEEGDTLTTTGPSSTTGGLLGVLVPPGRKRGRPLGSKTKNTNKRKIQPLSARAILPGPSATSALPSYAVPVPLSQQLTPARPSRETNFSLAKNASLMLNPFSKIVPGSIKLVADNDQVWEYKYSGTRRNWKKGPSGKVTVAKLNHWANTILRRRLPDNFPFVTRKISNPDPPQPKFEKWTEWERSFLEAHILNYIRENRRYLDEKDWENVADAQNQEFVPHRRLPGLPLAQLTSRTLTIDNVPVVRGGGFTKTDGYFPERTSSEIQNILYNWPDIQEKIKEEVTSIRGKVPAFLDCDTELSDSEVSTDDENEANDTIVVDDDGDELMIEGESDLGSLFNE
ncbi:hypothetical protein NHQ30_007867 [Ciborinia camelliae]|nr:hypothetical protein NHQ30_007867 [Ciborinia camelliae]